MRPRITENLPDFMDWETVPALVGAHTTESIMAKPIDEDQCRETLAFCRRQDLTVCPRGNGHSYGDLPLNNGHVLLDTTAMDRIVDFDEETGRMVVQPGVRILDIYERAHHERWALPASPTESIITVAGAIAANVNGKDSWRVGNFGDQVLHLRVMTASGDIIDVDRNDDRELFLAIVGGLGLLGIVVEATLQLRRVPSPYLEIARYPVRDLHSLLNRLGRLEDVCDFAVVWIDTSARGERLGRGVIHATRWVPSDASADELRDAVAAGVDRLAARRRRGLAVFGVMAFVLSGLLQAQRLTVGFFNRLYYIYSKLRRRIGSADNVEMFLRYNFDASFTVPPAPTVCGPRGYAIQIPFPRDAADAAITELITLCQQAPCPPVMTVMRLHRRDDHLISFCEDGYSLNFELHPKKRHEAGMRRFLDRLMDATARFGGKVHLAKDMVLTREQFRRLYPAWPAFLAIKRRLDPDELFQSDLYRRLLRDDAPAGETAIPEIHVPRRVAGGTVTGNR